MEFRRFFESMEIIQQAAGQLWQGCNCNSEKCRCPLEGRTLYFYYQPHFNSVEIAFSGTQQGAIPGAQRSDKEPSFFFTAKTLQPGTIEGMHKLIQFAKIIKQNDMGINFSTIGRREDLYAKAMQRAGMTLDAYGTWR